MTSLISDALSPITHLFNQGGGVLWAISAAALLILLLASERLLFVSIYYRQYQQPIVSKWSHRNDTRSWQAYRIREAILADSNLRLNSALWLIKICVVVCPLLGLLGTVTGMISVFDVLSYSGTGDPRLMAAGIFQATIPTMAGMVVAIIGLILRQQVLRLVRKKQGELAQQLYFEKRSTPRNHHSPIKEGL
jgi:biopolymer transport protein ExbB